MDESKRLMLALGLSIAILVAWHFLYAAPQQEALLQQQKMAELAEKESSKASVALAPEKLEPVILSRQEAITTSRRIKIHDDVVHGSFDLKGGRFDDLTLAKYRETIDKNSPEVALLSPGNVRNAYFAQFGWIDGSGTNTVAMPDKHTEWQSSSQSIGKGTPAVLTWKNEQNVTFTQTISLKDDYLFHVELKVQNNSGETLNLHPYGLINRAHDPKPTEYVSHEGLIGVFTDTLEEVDYLDIKEDGTQTFDSKGGWFGISDKYWLTAMIPDANASSKVSMSFQQKEQDRYQIDFMGDAHSIPSGAEIKVSYHFFAGAKKVTLLDRYREMLNIPLFDRAVDFGTLYFLTKPMFEAIQFFYQHLPNFGLAILALTVLVKLLMFPLAHHSFVSMAKMREYMPEMQLMKERYASDKNKMQQEMMKFYQEKKINPMSGCLPLLIQIPVFFALYKVLYITIEMRHAPFYGWITDLSAPEPTTIVNLFGLLAFDPPYFLAHIGVWPLLMMATMIIQQKLNPPPPDPTQAMVLKMMPYIFVFLFATFPAGLVIYWTWSNTLSILQQYIITQKIKRKAKT